MSNILIVITVFVFGLVNLNSQERLEQSYDSSEDIGGCFGLYNPPNYIYGLYSGLAISNIIKSSEDPFPDLNAKYKYDYNIGFSVNINKWTNILPISFESGLYYVRKGGYLGDFKEVDVDGSIIGVQKDLTYIFNYLQVPININYEFVEFKNSSLNLFGGPFIAYLLSANYKTNKDSGKLDYEISYPLDLGLNIGLSYELRIINNSFIGILYNYQFGFNDPIDKNYTNSTHLINLFYKFY